MNFARSALFLFLSWRLDSGDTERQDEPLSVQFRSVWRRNDEEMEMTLSGGTKHTSQFGAGVVTSGKLPGNRF